MEVTYLISDQLREFFKKVPQDKVEYESDNKAGKGQGYLVQTEETKGLIVLQGNFFGIFLMNFIK